MFFSPCLYTISCYHTSIYFLLGPSFIPTICSKVIPNFFRYKFSLLLHELLLLFLIFLSTSYHLIFSVPYGKFSVKSPRGVHHPDSDLSVIRYIGLFSPRKKLVKAKKLYSQNFSKYAPPEK